MGLKLARISIKHAAFAFSDMDLCAFLDAINIVKWLGCIPNNYSRNKFTNSPILVSKIEKMTGMHGKRLLRALNYLEGCGMLAIIVNPNGVSSLTINPKLLA